MSFSMAEEAALMASRPIRFTYRTQHTTLFPVQNVCWNCEKKRYLEILISFPRLVSCAYNTSYEKERKWNLVSQLLFLPKKLRGEFEGNFLHRCSHFPSSFQSFFSLDLSHTKGTKSEFQVLYGSICFVRHKKVHLQHFFLLEQPKRKFRGREGMWEIKASWLVGFCASFNCYNSCPVFNLKWQTFSDQQFFHVWSKTWRCDWNDS